MKATTIAALAVFCAAALVTTGASGQEFKPVKPLQQAATAQPAQHTLDTMQELPRAPRVYTQQERAQAVMRSMRSSAAPSLGQPITLDCQHPVVPGVAHAVLTDVDFTGCPVDDPASGVARFNATARAAVIIDVVRQQQQWFAVDCRIDAPRVHYGYLGRNGAVAGDITPDANKHVVLAVNAAPTSGQYGPWAFHLYLYFAGATDSAGPTTRYWGCDIAPF